jgi:hypothetical protein
VTLIVGPTKWYQVAAGLRDAVYAGLSTVPSRYGVVPGAIAWDAGDCGLLAVSVAQVLPSNDFPVQETISLGNCTPALEVAEIVIQVIRCAPGIGEASDQLGALAPPTDDLDSSAQLIATDAHELMVSALSYLNGLRLDSSVYDYVTGGATVMGPEGGVVGNEMRVQVGLPYG